MAFKETVDLLKNSCIKISENVIYETAANIEINRDIIPLYMSSIGTIISLSIASIGLSFAFREKVLGQNGPLKLNIYLITAWSFLVMSVATGLWYLSAGTKLMEKRGICQEYKPLGLTVAEIYDASIISFCIGVLVLFYSMIMQLQRNPSRSE